jgi:hypothetical protein
LLISLKRVHRRPYIEDIPHEQISLYCDVVLIVNIAVVYTYSRAHGMVFAKMKASKQKLTLA